RVFLKTSEPLLRNRREIPSKYKRHVIATSGSLMRTPMKITHVQKRIRRSKK
ncbi:unnamed protein product, partial [Larinioides sclopetarius]